MNESGVRRTIAENFSGFLNFLPAARNLVAKAQRMRCAEPV
jgi:hypothetical protein